MESISSLLLKRTNEEEVELIARIKAVEKREAERNEMKRIRNKAYNARKREAKLADPNYIKPKMGRPKKVKSQDWLLV